MTKEDTISRAEALKIVDELNDGSSECANIRAEIEKLPSVQPKVKTGHWIPVDDKNDAFDCSECIAMVARKTNYCPRCGAKMESEG